MRQIDPDVVPVYPITPQTPIIQGFAKFVADGTAHGELVDVESEHSAMSAAIGSALAGARTMTATSSQGLALMAEVVYIAAAMRAPIVMAVGNRALSGPINIHCDHSDSMLIRDSGVVQLFAENAQEAYDLTVIAPAAGRAPRRAAARCSSARTASRSRTPPSRSTLLADADVTRFVGDYAIPNPLLDTAQPTTQGPFAMPDYYFELRHQQIAAHARPRSTSCRSSRWSSSSSRAARYGTVEPYRLDDADARARRARLVSGHDQGRRRRAARRGRAGRAAEDRLVPAVPARGARAELLQDVAVGDRPRPGGLARRRAAARAEVAAGAEPAGVASTATSTASAAATSIRRTSATIFAGRAGAYVGLRGEPCPA